MFVSNDCRLPRNRIVCICGGWFCSFFKKWQGEQANKFKFHECNQLERCFYDHPYEIANISSQSRCIQQSDVRTLFHKLSNANSRAIAAMHTCDTPSSSLRSRFPVSFSCLLHCTQIYVNTLLNRHCEN